MSIVNNCNFHRRRSKFIWLVRLSFTLVELLVVISIISVLAALLLPTLQSATEQSYLTSCSNNMRQHGISINVYAIDFAGNIPPTYRTVSANSAAQDPRWLYYTAGKSYTGLGILAGNGYFGVKIGTPANPLSNMSKLLNCPAPNSQQFETAADPRNRCDYGYPRDCYNTTNWGKLPLPSSLSREVLEFCGSVGFCLLKPGHGESNPYLRADGAIKLVPFTVHPPGTVETAANMKAGLLRVEDY